MTTEEALALLRWRECHEAVVRQGEDVPCEKTAVALRYDPEEGTVYPVCAHHARGNRMVPLIEFEKAGIFGRIK